MIFLTKAKAPHQGEECEAFRTASLGEGGGLAVRLMSGQRMEGRYGRPPAISSNGLQQRVPITPRHLKDDCDFLTTNQLLLHLQAIQVKCIVCRQQTHRMSGVIYYRNMSEAPFVH